jgi:ribosomal protein L16 Arg81 hydroxylase
MSSDASNRSLEPGRRLLEFGASVLAGDFDSKPFIVRHSLANHPLFELRRLAELARGISQENVEYNSGDVAVSLNPDATPRTGLSVEETIERIEECGSWMVIKNVERDPEYRELMDRCIDEVEPIARKSVSRICRREAFVFVSSPGSTTPYHVDHEHNFLLQVRGRKTINIFDPRDRSVISEEELEDFYSGGHRNLVFRDDLNAKASRFVLVPGNGLYFPVNAPHWVKNGPRVSISFSVTFRSGTTERRSVVYNFNRGIRRLGVVPAPVGQSVWRDAIKYHGFRALRRSGSVLRALSSSGNNRRHP